MLKWLRSRLSRPTTALPAEVSRPAWIDDVLEGLQKQSRATVKHNARLEAALAEQAMRIEELGRKLEHAGVSERAPDVRNMANEAHLAQQYAPLFDALDALDEASRFAAEPHLAAGLALVGQRVQSYCEQAGFRRIDAAGRAPDARLYRIVGTEARAGVADGSVSRVVRAAIVHHERVVREGEALIARATRATHAGSEMEDERMGH